MMTRRAVLAIGSSALAGCVSRPQPEQTRTVAPLIDPSYVKMYAALDDEPFRVPAVDLDDVDPKFWRREVPYATREQPGTVIVDPGARYAYLVLPGGRAIRYGVGVGKEEAFNFQALPLSAARLSGRAGHPLWI